MWPQKLVGVTGLVRALGKKKTASQPFHCKISKTVSAKQGAENPQKDKLRHNSFLTLLEGLSERSMASASYNSGNDRDHLQENISCGSIPRQEAMQWGKTHLASRLLFFCDHEAPEDNLTVSRGLQHSPAL